jgi:NAD(P)-dependent dehydrogenase (short-subunit alcohol dehydrogenase family)
MKSFKNKVAVVTGAGSGIGRNVAYQLAQHGAIVAICDIDETGLSETAQWIETIGGTVSRHIVDVTDRARMTIFADEVVTLHHHVDILINNAGVSLTPSYFVDIPFDQFERVIDINMWGVYYGIRAFLPFLRQRPEASIVNVASVAGIAGLMGYSPYVMSKFAVRGLTEALQMELVGTNVTVTSIHPGGVKTNLMRHAPDLVNDSQREAAHKSFVRGATLSAEKVAAAILKAIRKKRYKVVLGADARMIQIIRWLFPSRFPNLLHPVFKQLLRRQ